MSQWFNPANWAAIAAADATQLAMPASLPPALHTPAMKLAAELHASLEKAYFGPDLSHLGRGELPAAFEAEHRSEWRAASDTPDVLQIVSGQTLLGSVRIPQPRHLPTPLHAEEAMLPERDGTTALDHTNDLCVGWSERAAQVRGSFIEGSAANSVEHVEPRASDRVSPESSGDTEHDREAVDLLEFSVGGDVQVRSRTCRRLDAVRTNFMES